MLCFAMWYTVMLLYCIAMSSGAYNVALSAYAHTHAHTTYVQSIPTLRHGSTQSKGKGIKEDVM